MSRPLLPLIGGRAKAKVKEAATIDDLETAVTECLYDVGFVSSAYHLVRLTGVGDYLHSFFTDYPSEWINHYERSNYIHHDLVHRSARKSVAPVIWDDIEVDDPSPEALRVVQEGRDFKIGSGISVPVRGPNSFALFSAVPGGSPKEQKEIVSIYEPLLLWLGYHAHERAFELFQPRIERETDSTLNLTPRELECLRWIAAGKTTPYIGEILSISDHTVSRHIANAQRKLNTSTRAHAAVKAVTLGLIDVD